jgi:hypothetical protein
MTTIFFRPISYLILILSETVGLDAVTEVMEVRAAKVTASRRVRVRVKTKEKMKIRIWKAQVMAMVAVTVRVWVWVR